MTSHGPVWTGKVRPVREMLDWPLHRRKPARIFVNSMSDLFHDDVSWEFIDSVFGVMAVTQRHTYQILTKRPKRMRDYMARQKLDPVPQFPERIQRRMGEFIGKGSDKYALTWPLKNVWLGVSCEDQATADERIPLLLQTPAAVRFVSYEPALGPVDFTNIKLRLARGNPFTGEKMGEPFEAVTNGLDDIQWVIVGGESGPKARPFNIQWARDTIRQCKAAGIPVFMKQVGAFVVDRNDAGFDGCEADSWPLRADGCDPDVVHDIHGCVERYQGADCRIHLVDRAGADPSEWPEDLRVREFPA